VAVREASRSGDQINEAYERMLKSDVKYRFVIDMASPQSDFLLVLVLVLVIEGLPSRDHEHDYEFDFAAKAVATRMT
jgi:hypothetical protein